MNGFPSNPNNVYYQMELHLYLDKLEGLSKDLLRQSEHIVAEIKRQSKSEWRKWGNLPLVVIIGLISALAAIAIFVTGVDNLGDLVSEVLGRQPSIEPTTNSRQQISYNNASFEVFT